MQQALIEIDKSFVLHLAVTSVARSIRSFVLLAELDLVLGAVLADGDATLGTVVMLLAQDAHLFERSELS